MAIFGMIFRGGPALGALIMGTPSSHFGLQAPVACGAVLCGVFWLWARHHRAAMAQALECSERAPDCLTPQQSLVRLGRM